MKEEGEVLTAEEASRYLKISKSLFLKLVRTNQIRGRKVGRGWKVLESELHVYFKRGEE